MYFRAPKVSIANILQNCIFAIPEKFIELEKELDFLINIIGLEHAYANKSFRVTDLSVNSKCVHNKSPPLAGKKKLQPLLLLVSRNLT